MDLYSRSCQADHNPKSAAATPNFQSRVTTVPNNNATVLAIVITAERRLLSHVGDVAMIITSFGIAQVVHAKPRELEPPERRFSVSTATPDAYGDKKQRRSRSLAMPHIGRNCR